MLTFKGSRCGPCRLEYEYPLAPDAAQQALRLLPGAQIIRRYDTRSRDHDGLILSVDSFPGANAGSVLTEVELDDPHQPIDLPPWGGAEVTLDRRYSNSRLAWWPVSPPLARAA